MRFKVIELKGVGPQAAKALENAGFYYAEELLTLDVKKVSNQTKIEEAKLQRWKDYVHLMKVRTVGPAYANLMHRENVGISTVIDLSKANSDDLLKKIAASNKERRLVKVLPTLSKVKRWIETAKNLAK